MLSWTLLASALGPQDTYIVSFRSWGVPEVHRSGVVPVALLCAVAQLYLALRA